MTPDTGPLRLAADGTVALLDPQGGRLSSLVVRGRELLVQHGGDVFHWGSFPMAPWVGRVRRGRFRFAGKDYQLPLNAGPHALHGLVTDLPWTVTGPGQLEVQLGDPWPWPCHIAQTVAVSDDRIEFTIEVQAQETMPADVGWHPWFNRVLVDHAGTSSGLIQLEVDASAMYLNDEEHLPTGRLGPPAPRPWDYCFVGLARPPVVRWADVLEVTVHSDCSHWVIYDRESPGICVEPWTGPPNSLNLPNGSTVTPDRPLRASMCWAWRHLS